MPQSRPRRAWVRAAGAALSSVLVAAGLVAAAPAASAAPTSCPVVDYYVTTGGASQLLNRYTIGGHLVSSLPMPAHVDQYDLFTEIATNADGSLVYAVGGPVGGLTVIDTATGAARVQSWSGPVVPVSPNSLTSLPDGRLLAAAGRRLFVIDPVTGVSRVDARLLPAGYYYDGDLATLPDGDLLALTRPDGSPGPFSTLMRISPSGTVTILGTVRSAYGLTTSGGAVYLPSVDGTVRRLDPVPTAAGTGPLPAVPLVSLRLQATGAASVQDSGVCRPTFSASVSQVSTGYGDPLELIAYGLPRGATGSVTFASGGRTLCSAPAASPTTRCSPGRLDAGTYSVTARWSATGAEAGTSFTITKMRYTFAAGLVDYRLVVGVAPRLRAYGGRDDTTGPITMVAGDRLLCVVQRPDNTCTGPDDLPAGAYHVVATYAGDRNHTGWVTSTNFWVADPQPTQVRVAKPKPVRVGKKVTLRSSHLPAAARGPVTFLANGRELCTATLPHQSCGARIRLAAGKYRLTAAYAGQGTYTGSTATTTLKVLRRH